MLTPIGTLQAMFDRVRTTAVLCHTNWPIVMSRIIEVGNNIVYNMALDERDGDVPTLVIQWKAGETLCTLTVLHGDTLTYENAIRVDDFGRFVYREHVNGAPLGTLGPFVMHMDHTVSLSPTRAGEGPIGTLQATFDRVRSTATLFRTNFPIRILCANEIHNRGMYKIYIQWKPGETYCTLTVCRERRLGTLHEVLYEPIDQNAISVFDLGRFVYLEPMEWNHGEPLGILGPVALSQTLEVLPTHVK